jgi:hypothetical protein
MISGCFGLDRPAAVLPYAGMEIKRAQEITIFISGHKTISNADFLPIVLAWRMGRGHHARSGHPDSDVALSEDLALSSLFGATA